MRIVIATFNVDKARELGRLLDLDGIEVHSLRDFAGASAPPEVGQTLAENALAKARAARAHTGLAAIADDTGLEVDALGGAPGVHAARYAGPDATYADNVAKLLDRLASVPERGRTARFRTTCVACFPGGREIVADGVLEGRIGAARSGANGFGYDPVFVLPDGRTLAELTDAEKNRDSHRARALKALAAQL